MPPGRAGNDAAHGGAAREIDLLDRRVGDDGVRHGGSIFGAVV